MKIKVWDVPTRVFHWLLVILIAAAWWTGEERDLDWHSRIGFTLLILIVFRLVWGFIGSSTARFSSFVKGPQAILAYLRGSSPHPVGHNPLGALSVLALLGLIAAVVGLGLIATDEDGIDPGPLAYLVSAEISEGATDLHETAFDLLLVLIAIHIAAIFYYWLVKHDNLVGPMLTGRRELRDAREPMRTVPAWRFLLAVILALAIAWGIWTAG